MLKKIRVRRGVGFAGAVSLAVVALLVGLGVGSSGASEPAGRTAGAVPPADTIVAVTGDADNGFSIRRYDGSTQHPPTTSEAHAECEEYDTEVAVAVCIAEVDIWYRDLGELQTALRWAYERRGFDTRTHAESAVTR